MEKDIETLKQLLHDSWPDAKVTLDAPEAAGGSWWIDIRHKDRRLTLEFRPKRGFGIFPPSSGYGEGPSELYRTPQFAAKRVAQLLGSSVKTTPGLTLKEMRELLDRSQVELADKMGIKQPAVCRFESRREVKLGKLNELVQALGGRLEVRAHFSDADVALSVGD